MYHFWAGASAGLSQMRRDCRRGRGRTIRPYGRGFSRFFCGSVSATVTGVAHNSLLGLRMVPRQFGVKFRRRLPACETSAQTH